MTILPLNGPNFVQPCTSAQVSYRPLVVNIGEPGEPPVERMTIDAGGRVGLGITTPATYLDVRRSVDVHGTTESTRFLGAKIFPGKNYPVGTYLDIQTGVVWVTTPDGISRRLAK